MTSKVCSDQRIRNWFPKSSNSQAVRSILLGAGGGSAVGRIGGTLDGTGGKL